MVVLAGDGSSQAPRNQILAGRPLDGAFAEVVSIVVPVVALAQTWTKGTNIHRALHALMRDAMQIVTNTQLLLLCSFALMINGAHAHDHDEGFQNCVWELIRHYPEAAAGTLLACLLIVEVARRMMFSASPPGAARVPAFRIYPAVEGYDIDDVMKNAPDPTKHNSPLESLEPVKEDT